MRIYTKQLDIDRFKKDLSDLLSPKDFRDGEQTSMIESIERKAIEFNGDIPKLLKYLDSVVSLNIQKKCRCAVVAQMYNAKISAKFGSPYVTYSSYCNDLLFLTYRQYTSVLTKYGDIITIEGEDKFYLSPTNNHGFGFPIQKIEEDGRGSKYGFISNEGYLVLPFVFDTFRQHIGECNPIYNYHTFNLRVFGHIRTINRETAEEILKFCESKDNFEDRIYCISQSGILFCITSWFQEDPYFEGDINKLPKQLQDMAIGANVIMKLQKI